MTYPFLEKLCSNIYSLNCINREIWCHLLFFDIKLQISKFCSGKSDFNSNNGISYHLSHKNLVKLCKYRMLYSLHSHNFVLIYVFIIFLYWRSYKLFKRVFYVCQPKVVDHVILSVHALHSTCLWLIITYILLHKTHLSPIKSIWASCHSPFPQFQKSSKRACERLRQAAP